MINSSLPFAMSLQLLGSVKLIIALKSSVIVWDIYLKGLICYYLLVRLEEEGVSVKDIRLVLKTVVRRRKEGLGKLRKCVEIKEIMLEKDSKELGVAYRNLAEAYIAVLNFKGGLAIWFEGIEDT
ncbi:hypothetical protein SLE2022_246710 [Rubroshorea leprosula]